MGIRETNLRRIGHGGVSVAAVCQDHQLVCTLVQLEGCCAKASITQHLVDLLDAGTAEIVYGKIQAAANIHESRPRISVKWCLLQLGNTDYEIAIWRLGDDIFLYGDFLARSQCPENAKR